MIKTYAFIVNNTVANVAVFDEPTQDLLNLFAKESGVDLIIEADEKTAIGGTYDGTQFIPVSPFPSWTWDNTEKVWVAPTPKPASGIWEWSEPTLSWVQITAIE